MPQETRNRIAFLERREAELAHEESTLPTRGYHRSAWLKASEELQQVREELADERKCLALEVEWEAEEREFFASLSPEELAYHEEMLALYEKEHGEKNRAEWKARQKREAEAERRRENFQLILGGKYEG
jgi:hypothetical protein